jgi:hypothetical protein
MAKYNLGSAKKTLGQVGSKQGLMVVVYLVIIVLVLLFSKYVFKGLKDLLGFLGGEKTDIQVETETQQKTEIFNLKKSLKYEGWYAKKIIPRPITFYKGIADSLEQQFNKTVTSWATISDILKPLGSFELICVYIEFGSRYNTEWTNEQGDLFDWIVMEKNMMMVPSPFWWNDYTKTRHKFNGLEKFIPAVSKLSIK